MLDKIQSIFTKDKNENIILKEIIKQKEESLKNTNTYNIRIETIEKSLSRIENKIDHIEQIQTAPNCAILPYSILSICLMGLAGYLTYVFICVK